MEAAEPGPMDLEARLAKAEAEAQHYRALLDQAVAAAAATTRATAVRLEAVLDAAGVATFEADIGARRLVADDRFWRVLGHERSQIPDEAVLFESLLHPEDRPRAAAILRDHLAGERPSLEGEVRVRARDGQYRWLLLRGGVVERDAGGVPLRFCGTTMDVTDRKRVEQDRERLEAQLQQAQKFESLGILAGGIAHDFNNLLCGMLGNVDLAMLDLAAVHPAMQSLEEIRLAAQKATELCRQMLAYAGRERMVTAPVDLSETVARMEKLLRVSINKKVSLRLELHPALPNLAADASQLRQVLLNLVTNASEAIGDAPGVVSVRTGTEECTAEYLQSTYIQDELASGLYAFLEVSDTGCGMDRDTQARLFDPFFSTKFLGRGLGLAAVLGIVRAHHGTVKVYSEVGKGTTLKVLVPVPNTRVAERDAVDGAARWRGQGLVLFADDEPAVRSVGKRMLQRLGFDVLVAEHGREAVDIFEHRAADVTLVLLDMTMPHLDGAEAYRELRRVRPDVKVVLTSGYSESDATSRFAGKGLAGFVQKPFRLEALRAALRTALDAEVQAAG